MTSAKLTDELFFFETGFLPVFGSIFLFDEHL
jgi:hypothetical protein